MWSHNKEPQKVEDLSEKHLLIEILKELRKQTELIKHQIFPTKARLVFYIKGEFTVDVSMQVGQSVPVALVQSRADGSVYSPNKGDVSFQLQDTTILSIVDNGDGTGVVTALAPGTSGVAGADKTTGLSATGNVSVSAATLPPPTSAAIQFGTPTSPVANAVKKA